MTSDELAERVSEIRDIGRPNDPARAANELGAATADLLSVLDDVAEGLAKTDQRTVYAFLDRVEEDVSTEAANTLGAVRDLYLRREGQ